MTAEEREQLIKELLVEIIRAHGEVEDPNYNSCTGMHSVGGRDALGAERIDCEWCVGAKEVLLWKREEQT